MSAPLAFGSKISSSGSRRSGDLTSCVQASLDSNASSKQKQRRFHPKCHQPDSGFDQPSISKPPSSIFLRTSPHVFHLVPHLTADEHLRFLLDRHRDAIAGSGVDFNDLSLL